jgi:hypothetical protein
MSAPPFAFIVPECHTGRDNEGTTKDKKRKAPTRKNPHERLTVKGFTLEAKIKYHVLTCKTRVSTKLVRIKQKKTRHDTHR